MSNENRVSKLYLSSIAFPLVFVIAAILVSFNAVRNFELLKNTVSIEATVISVDEDIFSDSDNSVQYVYQTNVDYTFKGQEYKNISLGLLDGKHKIGETITINIDKDNPSSPHDIGIPDVFFPIIGALAFGIFGLFILFKFLKWQIEDIKKEKNKDKKLIAFRLPTKAESIVGLILATILALFIFLQVYVLNGMIIGAVVFGFFFLMWVDFCILK